MQFLPLQHTAQWSLLLLFICTLPTAVHSIDAADLPPCWTPCAFGYSGVEIVPGMGCSLYQNCHEGVVKNRVQCGDGLLYNVKTDYCDHKWNVDCDNEPTCPPTLSPSESPTDSPTDNPTTSRPTTSPTLHPTDSPSYTPTFAPTASEFALPIVRKSQSLLEKYVFVSYTSSGIVYPSIKYTFDDFYNALNIMAVQGFGAHFQFFLANDDVDEYIYGLVNLAAFLANAMVESIQYDSCDELNWQAVAGRYAISNSCGQQGRSYQDETCDEKYTCELDPEIEISAVDAGKGERAPPPFTCRPGSGEGHYSGYWDISTGTEINNTPYSSTTGRTDVENCCWWGRGALLTRNVCNIGKINYYLGSKAALDGRSSLYPDTDFCKFPEATCSSNFSEEMRWTVAMFEWADRIQSYESSSWTYEKQLRKFVNGGMIDDSFIMTVGRVLSNDCHQIACSTNEVRMADQRKENFYLILNDIFDVKHLNTQKPTRQPVEKAPPTLWTLTSSTTMSAPSPATPVQQPQSPYLVPPSYEEDTTTYEPTLESLLISMEDNSAVMTNNRILSALVVALIAGSFLMM